MHFRRSPVGPLLFRAFACVPEEARDAVDTNRLATRSNDFAAALCKEVEGSKMLRLSWPVAKKALGAHQRWEYTLSVPAVRTAAPRFK